MSRERHAVGYRDALAQLTLMQVGFSGNSDDSWCLGSQDDTSAGLFVPEIARQDRVSDTARSSFEHSSSLNCCEHLKELEFRQNPESAFQ